MSHVIAAISTPAGAAGLGVVRLSGDDAATVAAKLFRPIDANRPLTRGEAAQALYQMYLLAPNAPGMAIFRMQG